MSSTTTTGSSGVWFGDLSAVLRGEKRQPTPTAEHQLQQRMGGAAHGKATKAGAAASAKPGVERKGTGDAVGGGGMSDATVYMLFDRFTPS